MEVLTVAVEQRLARDVGTIGVKRSYWCLIGFGQNETGHEGVKRKSDGWHHFVDALWSCEARLMEKSLYETRDDQSNVPIVTWL